MDVHDTRNVVDEFKGMAIEDIATALDARGVKLEIAIENLERDFNMGTIVRSANAFGVRTVHVIGRRQWNKRGAMMTDKYLHVVYHETVADFATVLRPRLIVVVDNVEGSRDIRDVAKPASAVLVFGAEGPGVSKELLSVANSIVAIPQIGSTRSLNVGVAAGIAMWEWSRAS